MDYASKGGKSADISGDKVPYMVINELRDYPYDEPLIKALGGAYFIVMKVFYSTEFWEGFAGEEYEEIYYKHAKKAVKKPGDIASWQESLEKNPYPDLILNEKT
jgi:hypothetical protein